jgi:hypothetical protein
MGKSLSSYERPFPAKVSYYYSFQTNAYQSRFVISNPRTIQHPALTSNFARNSSRKHCVHVRCKGDHWPRGSVPGHSPITLPISLVRRRVNPKDGSCSCTYFARAHSPPIPLESLPTESNPWLLRLRFRCRRQRLHAEHRMGRLGPT